MRFIPLNVQVMLQTALTLCFSYRSGAARSGGVRQSGVRPDAAVGARRRGDAACDDPAELPSVRRRAGQRRHSEGAAAGRM